MSNQPTLVILAAGMGSRFGGNKQIEPVDDAGHIIIDFSIYDAVRAGFGKVVCIITPGMEADFRRAIGDRIHCLFVDTGLMRKDESEIVEDLYRRMNMRIHRVDAHRRFMGRLFAITDPQEKRRVIDGVSVR